jgi:hypothetical protein
VLRLLGDHLVAHAQRVAVADETVLSAVRYGERTIVEILWFFIFFISVVTSVF